MDWGLGIQWRRKVFSDYKGTMSRDFLADNHTKFAVAPSVLQAIFSGFFRFIYSISQFFFCIADKLCVWLVYVQYNQGHIIWIFITVHFQKKFQVASLMYFFLSLAACETLKLFEWHFHVLVRDFVTAGRGEMWAALFRFQEYHLWNSCGKMFQLREVGGG